MTATEFSGLATMINVDFKDLCFLVVEDNTYMRRVVRTLLNGFGAREVHEAEDGARGVEVFQLKRPDIVITDWLMPIVNGIELVRLIRNEKSSPNSTVPIILLTGHSEKRRVMEARDAGATEFLCKPISAEALYARVANCVINPRPFVKTKVFFGPDRRRFSTPLFRGKERRKANKLNRKMA